MNTATTISIHDMFVRMIPESSLSSFYFTERWNWELNYENTELGSEIEL
jgi:hypothetical protein